MLTSERIVELAETLINQQLRIHDKLPVNDTIMTRFFAKSIPDITMLEYMQRILKYAAFPPESLLAALIYMDRLALKSKYALRINSFNVHRVFITALVISVKMLCDNTYTNTHYAKVGGVSDQELRLLELEMLHALKYNVNVSYREMEVYLRRLMIVNGLSLETLRLEPIQVPDTYSFAPLCRREITNKPYSNVQETSKPVSRPDSALPSPDSMSGSQSNAEINVTPGVSTITPPIESYKCGDTVVASDDLVSDETVMSGKVMPRLQVSRAIRIQKQTGRPSSVYGTRGELSTLVSKRLRHFSLPVQSCGFGSSLGRRSAVSPVTRTNSSASNPEYFSKSPGREAKFADTKSNLQLLMQYVRSSQVNTHCRHGMVLADSVKY